MSNSSNNEMKLWEREKIEIESLEEKIKETTPARGEQLSEVKSFDSLPLSDKTRNALKRCKFTRPTKIQIGAIPHALAGRDILGAAKTGSGKTLAFLIPMLEKLFRSRWDTEDGLGALVITPTRELALQIFEVLRSVGHSHSFSAGLVIGGKDFKEEQYRLIKMNTLVCTPGRLLQHMEQTPNFDLSNVLMLILDEADRILDMGFSQQLTSIISYLPPQRQTLLFSATQTKSIKDLARLSLSDPEYIAVHEKSKHATPANLVQNYISCDLSKKMDVLYSFIKTHLKQKIIVFASTCRQVKFIHDVFCKMQPGVPLSVLHGKFKQGKRVEVYYSFLNKPAAVLFATDIAARGLDFPSVDWVVQLDCPEDEANYIHRVGRTARYNKKGKSLMLLLPSETEGMKQALDDSNIPISEIKLNPKKTQSTRNQIASIIAADKDMKASAQKAFMSYVRSVHLQPRKDIFDASALPLELFAYSYGLASAPRLSFLEEIKSREGLRKVKNVNQKLHNLKEKIKAEKLKKRLEKQLKESKLSGHKRRIEEANSNYDEGKDNMMDDDEDDEDDLMVVKTHHAWDKIEDLPAESTDKKNDKKKKKQKIRIHGSNESKVLFDDDGTQVKALEILDGNAVESDSLRSIAEKSDSFVKQVAERLKKKDEVDIELQKERVRAKHVKKRLKKKGDREDDSSLGAQLAVESDDSNDDYQSDSSDDSTASNNASDESDSLSISKQEELALKLMKARG